MDYIIQEEYTKVINLLHKHTHYNMKYKRNK